MKNISSQKYNAKNKGFALMEIIIASAIISIITFAIVSAAQKGLGLSQRAVHQTQASYLLEEGAEAVKTIRDSSWATISALTLGTTYYLSFNTTTNLWSLSTTPSTIDSFFTRTVVVSAVSRDVNDDIASSGTVDVRTKKVVVTTSWPSSSGTLSKTLSFYVADVFN